MIVKGFRRGMIVFRRGYDGGEMMGMKVVICVTDM